MFSKKQKAEANDRHVGASAQKLVLRLALLSLKNYLKVFLNFSGEKF